MPIRARLTVAFAVAMAIVLVLAGAFTYLRVDSELNSALGDALRARADNLEATLSGGADPATIDLGGPAAEGSEDTLSQIASADLRVIGSSERRGTPAALEPSELAALGGGSTLLYRDDVAGIDGQARLLVRAVGDGASRRYLIVGASTSDRDETLANLTKAFAIGGPLALLLASALGYGLATLAMRPVEAMRSGAARITLQRSGERLPVPAPADEISRLGMTLNEMLARIEGSLEREREFVADASHELRTPLAILRSELELGSRPDREEADRLTAMRSAAEEVERLQSLTDDLLTLARSDGRSVLLDPVVTEVAALLERVRSRFSAQTLAVDRPIDVSVAGPMSATIDARRIEGALANLIDNAIRHGGGPITVAARARGGVIVFTVSDQGDGFPPAFAKTAFERFSRAEAGRTTPGSGLGLAIVKAIAEAHGGSVSIIEADWGATVEMVVADLAGRATQTHPDALLTAPAGPPKD